MAGGRPRTVSLQPEGMIELGEEMCNWVKEHPDILHLSQWYSIEKMYTEKQWDAMQQMPEFLPYYERALRMVGIKYLDKTSNIRESAAQRWQRVYFRDLRKQEDSDLEAAAERAKKVEQTHCSPELEAKFNDFLNHFKSSSNLNIEDSNIKSDK